MVAGAEVDPTAAMAMQQVAAAIEELRARCATYEQQQRQAAEQMAAQVATKVNEVIGDVNALYAGVKQKVEELDRKNNAIEATLLERTGRMNAMATAIEMMEARLKVVENKDGGNKKVSLLHRKDMKPKILEKEDGWRRWKTDVEDYTEEVFEGMRAWMEKTKDADEMITREWFETKQAGAGTEWWSKGDMLHRYLKAYSGTEARRIVLGVSTNNGWEAWRKLNQHYEPHTVHREGQVLNHFTAMINKRAKDPKELKERMVEYNERWKRVEEVTGHAPEARHAMSVLAGILDPETSKYTMQYQVADGDLDTLRRKVMAFINVSNYALDKSDKMDIGMVHQFDPEHVDVEDYTEFSEYLAAMGEKCHACGGVGHYARECPTQKGKGKGKGGAGKGYSYGKGFNDYTKGTQKGKAKGKGKSTTPQYGTCWTCGGAHFARNCPNEKGSGKGGANAVQVHHLCSTIEVKNRYQLLERDDEEEERAEEPLQKTPAAAMKPRRRRWGTINVLREIVPEGINNLGDQEWEELEMTVDSGATETVINDDMLQNIDTKQGNAYKRGVKYEVANGEVIDNLGEKTFEGVLESGEVRGVTAQVCDVNKALMSVRKMVNAGNRVVFEPNGGYIENMHTGSKIDMMDKGGMYTIKMWVQRPFHRQADARRP